MCGVCGAMVSVLRLSALHIKNGEHECFMYAKRLFLQNCSFALNAHKYAYMFFKNLDSILNGADFMSY